MGLKRDVDDWLAEQRGVVAVWQLVAEGHEEWSVDDAMAKLRQVHDGVYLSGHAPITDWQRWKAATLTAPGTRLSGWSAASFLDVRDASRDRFPTTTTRPGNGGIERIPRRPGRIGSIVIGRSDRRMAEDSAVIDDILSMTAGRTVLDLIPKCGDEKAARLVRDALRRTDLTGVDLLAVVGANRGVRGVARLRTLTELYGDLPAGNTRSDAEILAVALFKSAGLPSPAVNRVIGGEEADLIRFDIGLILELDGPQYHQFAAEDARKTAIWESHGFVVRRLPTGTVYDRPDLLFDAWVRPLTSEELARAGRRAQ